MPYLPALSLLLAQAGPALPPDRNREVQLIVPRRECRAVADGTSIELDDLTDRAKAWRVDGRAVRFRTEEFAPYDCVEQVLRKLREADVTIRATGSDPVLDVGGRR